MEDVEWGEGAGFGAFSQLLQQGGPGIRVDEFDTHFDRVEKMELLDCRTNCDGG